MLVKLLKISFFTFVATYISLHIFYSINSYKNEKISVEQALTDTIKVKDNFEYLKQNYIVDTTYASLVYFMQGKTVEEVKEILISKKYGLSDFGIKFKTDCDYNFVFDGEEKIICNLNGNLKYSGDLIFKKVSSTDWICEYTGDKEKAPKLCLNNNQK